MTDVKPVPPTPDSNQQQNTPQSPSPIPEPIDTPAATNTQQSAQAQSTGAAQPASDPLQNVAQPQVVQQQTKTNGWALASLIFGIVSLALVIFAPIALPAAILALIFAFVARRQEKSTMSTAGLITGCIGLVLTIVITAFGVVLVGNAIDMMLSYEPDIVDDIHILDDEYEIDSCLDSVEYNMSMLTDKESSLIDSLGDMLSDDIYGTTGMSLDDMGIDEEEFALWIFEDFTYEIEDVTLWSDGTGNITINYSAKNYPLFLDKLQNELDTKLFSTDNFGDMTEDEIEKNARSIFNHVMTHFDSDPNYITSQSYVLWTSQQPTGEWTLEDISDNLFGILLLCS